MGFYRIATSAVSSLFFLLLSKQFFFFGGVFAVAPNVGFASENFEQPLVSKNNNKKSKPLDNKWLFNDLLAFGVQV